MPRLLALEWDGSEARAAIARTRGKSIVLEHVFAIPLPKRDGAGADVAIGKEIAAALATRGWKGGEALVSVGRSSIELRFLTTPPAPADELPDLVRFQAMRQFSALGDQWPLDYVPLGAHADGGINALAAAIAPELVSQTKAVCAAAGIECKRLVLRPFAAAALVRERSTDGGCAMLIDVLPADADLTVLAGAHVAFPRTVRLPTGVDDETLARAMLAEVRRTIVAAQNQLGGRRVDKLIVFGDGKHQSPLRSLLKQELQLDAELLDPLTLVESTDEAKAHRPEGASAFAPLIGMLVDEAAEEVPAIDFLHPRRRAEPPNRTRLYSLLSGGGALVAVFLLGFIWWQLSSLDAQLRRLRIEAETEKKLAVKGKPVRDEVARIEEFARGDVLWLAELRAASEKFPPADQARVDSFVAGIKSNSELAQINLEGGASDSKVIAQIENSLRDPKHEVYGNGGRLDEKAGDLSWRFKEDVRIPLVETAAPAGASKTSKSGAPKSATGTGQAVRTKQKAQVAP